MTKRTAPIKVQPLKTATHAPQPIEIYSHQFYKEKIQPLVKAEVEENNVQKRDQLGVIKTLTKAAFEAEPEDIWAAIIAQASALKTENALRKAQARNAEPDLSPQGYAKYAG